MDPVAEWAELTLEARLGFGLEKPWPCLSGRQQPATPRTGDARYLRSELSLRMGGDTWGDLSVEGRPPPAGNMVAREATKPSERRVGYRGRIAGRVPTRQIV
ncbi:hypothetical protein IMZ48_31800 [Candidatus Bathyarchaeota archaeon]|nr:hypothetical protein [Candidatus Bathyarchaeota archaeon]